MSRFPSAAHLLSWACLCPRNDESAGKRRSNRVRKGSAWLKTTMVQCTWAGVRKKDSYRHALFYRIRARRGDKKAIPAVAASMLTAIYHIHQGCNRVPRPRSRLFRSALQGQPDARLGKRLADLGCAAQLTPITLDRCREAAETLRPFQFLSSHESPPSPLSARPGIEKHHHCSLTLATSQ
jgi:transposase